MTVVGLIAGFVAGLIWKDDRKGDYPVAIIAAIITGMMSFFVVPMMGFPDTLKWISISTEPFLVALGVLWLIRYAKKNQ